MQRNQNPGQNPRHNAERDAAQPIAGQPRTDEEDDELQDPEAVPSFLTARELQARDSSKAEPRDVSVDGDASESDEEEPPRKKGGGGKTK
jgi:hypothetical protein